MLLCILNAAFLDSKISKPIQRVKSKKSQSGRRQHKNVTVRDVARLAGVSPMTVSRVINEESNVLPATRETVSRAIEQLGFSPNKAARSLASASPIKFSLLYINPHNTFLAAILIGMFDHARQSDSIVDVTECRLGSNTLETIEELLGQGIDGFILGPPLCDSESTLNLLEKRHVPAVTIGARHGRETISSVSIDDNQAMYHLTKHVISQGHEKIAFLIGNPEQSASWLRLEGFKRAMKESGIDIRKDLVVQGRFAYLSGVEIAENLLTRDDRPTAILACNDDMAAGVITTAKQLKIRVPADLTVCGFDDTMFATTIDPPITTIHQPIAQMSRTAIKLLENCIRRKRGGAEWKPRNSEHDFELIVRNSDGPPPS